MKNDEQYEMYDPDAPAALTLDQVIDQAIIRDNQSSTGTLLHIEEADESE